MGTATPRSALFCSSNPWTELKIEEKQDGSGGPLMEDRVHLSLTFIHMNSITTLK